jgi:ankyrin repeat protein
MGIFQSLTRKTPSGRLAKQDENGLSLMHYAAIYNRPLVLTSLILSSVDVNIKQQVDYLAVGPMALHYAARCGSLDSMSCLLSNYANISYADHTGWAPIHHAAYFDNVPAIKLILRRQEEVIELITRGEYKWPPILLAASAGSLESIKCLMSSGANWTFHDDKGYNLIHIAAHRNHTNIIEYFITLSNPLMSATNIIINMLKSSREADQQAAVKCLQGMTTQSESYSKQILEANGVEQLVSILRTHSMINNNNTAIAKTQQMMNLTTLSVLCNISDNPLVRECLSKVSDITTILTKLIEPSSIDDVQSRAAILISDVASVKQEIRDSFAEKGCIEKLAKLLESDIEDVLVNTINAIEAICRDNEKNQNRFAEINILVCLVDLLTLNSGW